MGGNTVKIDKYWWCGMGSVVIYYVALPLILVLLAFGVIGELATKLIQMILLRQSTFRNEWVHREYFRKCDLEGK